MELVEVKVICDRCYQSSEKQVPATETVTVAFGSPPFHELDLCADHAAPYRELQRIAEQGRPLKRSHKKKAAGSPVRQTPPRQPLPRKSAEPGAFACPEPDCDKSFDRSQGLALHRRRHEMNGILCPDCDRSCQGLLGLITHRRSHGIHQSEAETLAAVELADRARNPTVAEAG